MEVQAFRATIFHCLQDPGTLADASQCFECYQDGLLVVEGGIVKAVGNYADLHSQYADVSVQDYSGKILAPGFIDTHIHYPQTEMIGSYGTQLLDWLNTYTFPTEAKFSDKEYCHTVARVFLKELLRAGTTTALVFSTVHPQSADALFEESEKLNLRMITGKVMMDREPFAPEFLRDTAESSYTDSKALIEKWHNKGRLLYAITPRFAVTSTEEQLAKAKQLMDEHPTVYLQTHINENVDEISLVKDLFKSDSYLEVYDRHGLLGNRTVLMHCVHMSDREWQRMHETNTGCSFCPTSNLFIGSGLFDLNKAEEHKVKCSLGTDVGGGTTFSMLKVMGEAYKVCQLKQRNLSPSKAFYLATLGGAETLSLSDKLGNLQPGKEADFIILDPASTPLLEVRSRNSTSILDKLFSMMVLGDERAVVATFAMGKKVHCRNSDA
eukprot:GILI01020389.1.p1 GENE.GILI01020389.1~~GILI01020389.1.p1  ORF type:complete len:438 (+),score=126.66 GILI01020389.1:93-1406(+)